jgi:hypothetical protein
MKKITILLVSAFFVVGIAATTTVKAQINSGKSPLKGSKAIYHELSFGGTASTSGILQTFGIEAVKVKPYFNPGGGLQINYALHFNENISLIFGAAAKYCQSTYRFDRFYENSVQKWLPVISSKEETFLFSADIRDYSEIHRALYMQFPLLFGCESGTSLAKWYVNVGAAAQLTVYSKYWAEIARLTTEGHSTEYNGTLEMPADLGFGTEENINVAGIPTLKFTVNGYLETGTKISIGKSSWLYIGLFGEISALKNSVSQSDGSGREYLINHAATQSSDNLMDNLKVTSIINTKYTSGGMTYCFGGVIRIGFDFHSSNRMLSSPLR